jgi:Ca2+-transporting ATPase
VIPSAYTLPAAVVARMLQTNLERGLDQAEAERRLAEHGPNLLRQTPGPGIGRLLLDQLDDFVIRLLLLAALVAAGISYVQRESYVDSVAIVLIVALNAVIGVIQTRRAENALRALQDMAAPEAVVVREGRHTSVPARLVVPGDVVALETGQNVPADVRVIESANLRVEEAALTGESLAVRKEADLVLDAATERGDQRNMAFMSTTVSYGRGKGLVVATGMGTAIGQIAELIESYHPEETPLQQRLDALGRTLGNATMAVCAVVFLVGVARSANAPALLSQPLTYVENNAAHLVELFMVAVSLAIAAVPEGLPAVVTVSLSIGMQRMVRRNALVRRLPAVETLGSATVICSDKTGTLTQNEMMVVEAELEGASVRATGEGYAPEGSLTHQGQVLDPAEHDDLRLLGAAAVLASDAIVEFDGTRWRVVGDPTEGALVTFAARAGIDRAALTAKAPRVAEIPFDSRRKRMTTIHRVLDHQDLGVAGVPVGSTVALVKGAPDVVLDLCTYYHSRGSALPLDAVVRGRVIAAMDEMAARALRILAVAYRPLPKAPPAGQMPVASEVERELVLVGLVGIMDPPRPEVASAIARARHAGVRTVMVTGDHKDTAVAVAAEIGLLRPDGMIVTGAELSAMSEADLLAIVPDVDVFARVAPEHKVRIVDAMKADGQIVAMTGDGVNDAPALKRAHIGVAMGLIGTDVSRQTADMVLTDDNYASIVAAIEEGRTIYNNIRKFVFYLLSCNIGEILIIFLAMLLGLAPEPPLLPIQLLWLNLVTDGLPALALGLEPAEPDVMDRPPRDPHAAVLSRNLWTSIGVQSVVDSLATLGAFVWAYNGPATMAHAQTVAFATLVTAELLRAFTARSQVRSIFAQGPFSNRWMVLATASSFALLLLAIYAPSFSVPFRTEHLPLGTWAPVLGFAVLPAAGAEAIKWWLRRSGMGAAVVA